MLTMDKPLSRSIIANLPEDFFTNLLRKPTNMENISSTKQLKRLVGHLADGAIVDLPENFFIALDLALQEGCNCEGCDC